MDTKIASWMLGCAVLLAFAGDAQAKKGGNGNQWTSIAGNSNGPWNGDGVGSHDIKARGNSPYIKPCSAYGLNSKDSANLAKGIGSGAIRVGGSPNNVRLSVPGTSYQGRYVNGAYNSGNGTGLWNGNNSGSVRSAGQHALNSVHPTGQNRAAAQHLLNSTYKLNKQNGKWK